MEYISLHITVVEVLMFGGIGTRERERADLAGPEWVKYVIKLKLWCRLKQITSIWDNAELLSLGRLHLEKWPCWFNFVHFVQRFYNNNTKAVLEYMSPAEHTSSVLTVPREAMTSFTVFSSTSLFTSKLVVDWFKLGCHIEVQLMLFTAVRITSSKRLVSNQTRGWS